MQLVDAHTHMNNDDLYVIWQDILAQFVQAGGVGLVNAGASDLYNTRALELSQQAAL